MSNTGKVLNEVIEVGSIAQLEAEQWFSHNGLSLNLSKTQTMILSLRDIKTDNPDTVKFLGVTIDPTLNWKYHVDSVASKLAGNIYLLRLLGGCVSKHTLKTAYYTLCHSIMSYAILACGDVHPHGTGFLYYSAEP